MLSRKQNNEEQNKIDGEEKLLIIEFVDKILLRYYGWQDLGEGKLKRERLVYIGYKRYQKEASQGLGWLLN
jgi:hypothetical protein